MPEAISTGDLFDALSNRRRRQVIRELEAGAHTIGALAEAIARVENDIPDDESVTGDTRKAPYVCLYQTHLDKLHRWGIVEWDKNRGTIEPGAAHGTAVEVLNTVSDDDYEPVSDRLTAFIGGVTQ